MTKRKIRSSFTLFAVLIPLIMLSMLCVSCKSKTPSVTAAETGTKDQNTSSVTSDTTKDPVTSVDNTTAVVTEALPPVEEYTVSFDTGGAGRLSDVVIKKGEKLSLPDISLDGATFDGWYLDRALTKKANSESLLIDKDVKFYAKWIKEREIRLYTGETEYTSLYYMEGSSVDFTKWNKPSSIIFKGIECEFSHWVDEQLDDIVSESFVMPSSSLAFYAVYEDIPSLNSFYTIGEGDSVYYESIEANAMTSIKGLGAKYGRWEVTITEKNPQNSRLGIFINAKLEGEKKFGEADSGYGLYLHHNISSNTRFAIVDYYNGYKTGISYEQSLPYASATAFTSSVKGGGLEKYYNDNKALQRGEADSLVFTLGIETLPGSINVYVNGEYIGGVNDPDIVKLFTEGGVYNGNEMKGGTEVGFTSNSEGTVFSDFRYSPAIEVTYDFGYLAGEIKGYVSAEEAIGQPSVIIEGIKVNGWYTDKELTKELDPESLAYKGLILYADAVSVETKNNFYVYTDTNGDVTYEAIVANAMTAVDDLGGKYGKWEVTVTESNPQNTRLGIFINASIPDSVKYGAKPSGYGFYLHHNVSANSRFVLVDYYDGYRGVNAQDYKSISYNASSGSGEGGIRKYYEDNLALASGEIDELVFTEAIEVTPTAINIYINGELIGSYKDTSVIEMFTEGGTYNGKEIKAATGVGFTSSVAGTKFSGFKFTPYTEE